MGFQIQNEEYYADSRPLHKALLSWVRKNFAWLYSYNPRIAEACLVDGITYNPARSMLIKTYPAEGLRREPLSLFFQVSALNASANNEGALSNAGNDGYVESNYG